MSKIEIAKMTDLQKVEGKVDGLHKIATTGNYEDLSNTPNIPVKVTKTSELTNDSGFITASDIPATPDVPTKLSQLANDENFITLEQVPSNPTKLSELTNDAGFITEVNGTQVTASVEGLEATNVQGLLLELKLMIDSLSTT